MDTKRVFDEKSIKLGKEVYVRLIEHSERYKKLSKNPIDVKVYPELAEKYLTVSLMLKTSADYLIKGYFGFEDEDIEDAFKTVKRCNNVSLEDPWLNGIIYRLQDLIDGTNIKSRKAFFRKIIKIVNLTQHMDE